MHKLIGQIAPLGAAALAFALAAAPASARSLIDFGDDFAVNSTASSNGWSYLWNRDGPVNSQASYVPLVADGAQYDSAAGGAYPDPAAGNFLALGRRAVGTPQDLLDYPPSGTSPTPDIYLRPGPVVGGVERAVALRYTFTDQDVPSGGALVQIPDYTFFVSTNSSATTPVEGMSARVFDGGFNQILYFSSTSPPPFFPGFRFDPSLQPPGQGAIPLGVFRPGESVWFVIGADQADTGLAGRLDEMRLDVTLQVVPEPAGLSLLAGAGLLFARRPRRR
jgi:hypothetical protein